MSSSRIVELAGIIQEHTTKLDSYLLSHDLPAPSFDVSYPARVTLPPEIEASQDTVLEASDELTALLLGPVGSLIGKNRVCIPVFISNPSLPVRSSIHGRVPKLLSDSASRKRFRPGILRLLRIFPKPVRFHCQTRAVFCAMP